MYQFKITLTKTNPEIWRRIVVDSYCSFETFHHIIQIAMGWTNSHLFEFTYRDYHIGILHDDHEEVDKYLIDASKTMVGIVITEIGERMTYVYDFGDNWEHEIVLEDISSPDILNSIPVCLNGEFANPPEDCGGISGFYNLLEILKDKKHPEYADIKIWVGRGYKPEFFNILKANKTLANLGKYIGKFNRLQ